ncbi:MAG TPA: hypothetical protein VFY29_15295 [Terriglobia bacterium]|nr:hypothetical protein [Terriglobia bacterium]
MSSSGCIDAIPGFVWSAGPAGAIELLNQRGLDYTGLSLSVAGTGSKPTGKASWRISNRGSMPVSRQQND